MQKICPRCGAAFVCCADGDMAQCHCAKVTLSATQRATIKAQYSDCLCNSCLLYFAEI
uniref:cysteine-rich CWC family protein n=1 Tax=Alistipes sp. TaxID=1872444 RepID=UPI0040571740